MEARFRILAKLLLAMLLALPAAVHARFAYVTNNGTIVIVCKCTWIQL